MKLSKRNTNLLVSIKKGYRTINGIVYSPAGKALKQTIGAGGYYEYSIKDYNNKLGKILIHRLVAYQKYGDKLFEKGIVVRHLDGNKLNNLDTNILIGSMSDNMMDIDPKTRLSRALSATIMWQKHKHNEIIEYYNKNRSYKQTMKKFKISSKGTLFYILKSSRASEKI